MVINHKKSKLTKVGKIHIPAAFFNRMSTGVSQLDNIYGGEGILPGSVTTIAAAPGSGKTTLLLQLCEALANNGNYKTAYLTGEESVEMLAYTCKRLGLTNVYVGCETDVEKIIEALEEMDFVVFDSFPCLTEDGKRLNRLQQDTAISNIVSACKKYETALAIILHVTKSGAYKGSTTITHAVDINMEINIDEDDTSIRTVSTSKNRYGSLADVSMYFGYKGFDFDKIVEPKETAKPKAKRKDEELEQIRTMKEPPGITVERVCKALKVDATRANYLLRALVGEGSLVKYGRGANAMWKHIYGDKVQTK